MIAVSKIVNITRTIWGAAMGAAMISICNTDLVKLPEIYDNRKSWSKVMLIWFPSFKKNSVTDFLQWWKRINIRKILVRNDVPDLKS